MKKFLLKTLDVVLTIIMVVSCLYSVFNLVMAFLPVEIQTKIFTWLNMSEEYITSFSISSVISAAVIVATKIAQTQSRTALLSTLSKTEQTVTNDLVVNEIVIDRVNSVINNLNVMQSMFGALLSVQKVTAERNIGASDTLVLPAEKEAYKNAIAEIEKAKEELSNLKNITTVYEKTEVKEVVVEKEVIKDEFAGRV